MNLEACDLLINVGTDQWRANPRSDLGLPGNHWVTTALPETGAHVQGLLVSENRVTGPSQLWQKVICLSKLSLIQLNSLDFKCVSTQCPNLMGICPMFSGSSK